MKISIDDQIKILLPSLRLGLISFNAMVLESSGKLMTEIHHLTRKIQENEEIARIHEQPLIQETRNAYKICGKEPSRYRPSAEALRRRIIQGKELYQINNIVEIINLSSLDSSYSIGGYDISKIKGEIYLGIGKKTEDYQAIARGALNIENLPVLRDSLGAFGSPTSDSERTKINSASQEFLLVFFDFFSNEVLIDHLDKTVSRLKAFAKASDFRILTVE